MSSRTLDPKSEEAKPFEAIRLKNLEKPKPLPTEPPKPAEKAKE